MAGWLAGRRNPRDFKKILKFIIDRNNGLLALFNKRKALAITAVPMRLSLR